MPVQFVTAAVLPEVPLIEKMTLLPPVPPRPLFWVVELRQMYTVEPLTSVAQLVPVGDCTIDAVRPVTVLTLVSWMQALMVPLR